MVSGDALVLEGISGGDCEVRVVFRRQTLPPIVDTEDGSHLHVEHAGGKRCGETPCVGAGGQRPDGVHDPGHVF